MKKLITWHKEFANNFMKKTGIDSYQLAWFSWAKGFIMGIILMMLLSGCSMLFNPDKYNPNPTIPEPVVEEPIKVDTIRVTNGIDTIIILDTLKTK